ncbi:MAG: hypothetical protein KDC43_16470 [Saprospiraceae bacterium]|nr:hypothetical protein [Saprospiraceae bacterium]MCB0625459.1 hypothetical protein [Saprospiraceae bacterium]MCB0681327.1 hypothetical protein [Saprospiraceae bacterium]
MEVQASSGLMAWRFADEFDPDQAKLLEIHVPLKRTSNPLSCAGCAPFASSF